MGHTTKAELERRAVDRVLRSKSGAYVAAAVGDVYAYPGVRTPWEAFKVEAGTGGGTHHGIYVHHDASGILARNGTVETTISWRRAAGIALREGLILRAIADAYPQHCFIFARNEEIKERAAALRRVLNKENKDADFSSVQIWEDPDGQVQRRDGRRNHQGRPGGRGEVPIVRE